MAYTKYKQQAINLRKNGQTYSEICIELSANIPKSTLATWCRGVKLSKASIDRIRLLELNNLVKARLIAQAANKKKQHNRLKSILDHNRHLSKFKSDKDVAKIILATIYLCEGTKSQKQASITLGNSDPLIISLFLQLLRFCYNIDEGKFRCTVQCRNDQDIPKLERFWQKTTKIPKNQFYGARIDPRSVGKKSMKPDYRGVCRINYLSSEMFWTLTKIGEILC